ncbi:MAG: hypothetical protein QNJ61_02315 [Desulfobacterales bacterium]|nr:hypothetical protein [Desulfobacterales bacterium]
MPGLTLARTGLLLALALVVCACPASPPPAPSTTDDPLGPVELLTFMPDDNHYLMAGHRLPVEPTLRPGDAIQQLADQLNRTYFNAGREPPAAGIRIEVLEIDTIDLPHRPLRVVSVNLHDPQQTAWRSFFQGSAGGQTTYYLLAATLMQPHLDPPLADGLVVLYNGEVFPELDHIRFRGIVSAESIRPVVLQALQRRQPRAHGVSG